LATKPRREEHLVFDRRQRAKYCACHVDGVADDERERASHVLRLHGGGDGVRRGCRRCGGLCCASLLASTGRRLRGCVWLPPRQRTLRRTPPLESCVTIKRGLELVFECDLLVRWLGECIAHSIRGAEE